MKKYKKAINFDLDTKTLQKIFQSKNPFVYMEGYRQIGSFLKSNGFKHRQWSGYISKEPMSNTEITGIVRKLNKSLPWLKQCVRKFDVTNIGETFDLMFVFKHQKVKAPAKEQDGKQPDKSSKQQQQAVLSVKDIKRNTKIISEKATNAPKKEQSRNKDNVL
ncbi:VapD family protein [Candidatus Pseudoruminococcus sp.]|uniref:VapD family protein n=1 Tax=Candidatus Pseudoruminococcus sp. TaxID=3101048 RepID=UPI00399A255F